MDDTVSVAAPCRDVTADEVEHLHGEVSWISPVARALLKARVGDEVTLVTPQGSVQVEVLSVHYPAP